MTNDESLRDRLPSDSPSTPFVAPIPGLGAFTPAPDPYVQATFRYEGSQWLLMPLAFWTVGVFQGSWEALVIAFCVWVLSYPIYGLWSLWRIKDADPKTDLWRPAAVLVLGSVPLFIPVLASDSRAAFAVLDLIAYLAGITALIAARNGWPRRRVPTLFATSAGACFVMAVLAVFTVVALAIGTASSHPGTDVFIFGGIILAIAGAFAFLGVGLTRAALRVHRAAVA